MAFGLSLVFLSSVVVVVLIFLSFIYIWRRYARTGGVLVPYREATFSNMQGKVCLITGGNCGIGQQTALGLAKMGANVYIACRTKKKAEEAIEWILSSNSNIQRQQLHYLPLDLNDFDSIRQCVDMFEQLEPNGLNVLINNAAMVEYSNSIISPSSGKLETFTVNQLGPFLLTKLLLPTLQKASTEYFRSRIVVVASQASNMAQKEYPIDDQHVDSPNCNGFIAYCNSKLANIMFTFALHRRLSSSPNQSIVVNAVHPGWVQSELSRNGHFTVRYLVKIIGSVIAKTSWQGAQTSIRVATSNELEGVSGKYFEHCTSEIQKLHPAATSKQAQEQLWEICSKLTGVPVN